MRRTLVLCSLGLLVVVPAFALAGVWAARTYFPRDLARLQGTWLVTSVHRNGAADPGQVGAHLTFAGDTVTFEPVASGKLQEMQLYLS